MTKLTKLQEALEATVAAEKAILNHYGKEDPEDLFDWPRVQDAFYAIEQAGGVLASAAFKETLENNCLS